MTKELKLKKGGNVFKVKKRYTVQYAYAGYKQYSDFYEDKDGNLSIHRFSPSYAKSKDVPSLDNCKTIDEILEVINGFCNNTAKIHLINGVLPFYYNNDKIKEYISGLTNDVEEYIIKVCTKFFSTIVLPILIEKDFKLSTSHVGIPILIKKYDDDYDNIRDGEDDELEYICYHFTSDLNIYHGNRPDFKSEHGGKLYLEGVQSLLNHVKEEIIAETGLCVEL